MHEQVKEESECEVSETVVRRVDVMKADEGSMAPCGDRAGRKTAVAGVVDWRASTRFAGTQRSRRSRHQEDKVEKLRSLTHFVSFMLFLLWTTDCGFYCGLSYVYTVFT